MSSTDLSPVSPPVSRTSRAVQVDRLVDSARWALLSVAIYACPAITVQRGQLSVLDMLAVPALALAVSTVSYWLSNRRRGVHRA